MNAKITSTHQLNAMPNKAQQSPLATLLVAGKLVGQNQQFVAKCESEHAALVAVAEAAKLISEGDVMRMNPSFTHADTVLAYQKLLRQALANLAAVREGGMK